MKKVLLRTLNPLKDWAWSLLIAFGAFMIISALVLNSVLAWRADVMLSLAVNSQTSGEMFEDAKRGGD